MMQRKLLLLPALLVICAANSIWGQVVTLEQIMSAPFPSGLSAAPDRGLVAWVQNEHGVRNIWIAGPPEYSGRQLTQYAEDDGQELGSITWTPDAETIIFVRGGAPNRRGEIPNPTSDADGAERAVWKISVDGGEPEKVGVGASPLVSPKGDGLAYMNSGKVFWTEFDDDKKPEQLFKIRGGVRSLSWSFDGSKLAFVSARGTHSFIAVFHVESKKLQFIDPSVDRDGNPVWSPDGSRLAFTRIPAYSELTIFRPVREMPPWSIRIGDVASGKSKEIWRADEGAGSAFSGVVAQNNLFWGAGDHIVFPWEKTGWKLLYSVSANGGKAKLLTPGAFEIEYAALAPDRKTVVYNSNQDDIDRRDIWRVSVTGGPPTAVTQGNDIEWQPQITSDGKATVFLRSGAKEQAHPAIKFGDQAPQRMIAKTSEFPEEKLVEPEQIIFAAADGMKIYGQLFLPVNLKKGERYPAVLFFHGGSRRQMLLGWHYRGYYNNAYALNQYLANRGYIVLSVNYRSGTGYGMEFREAINYGASGGSEFNDVLGAGLYMRGREDVDPERIGLWGGSYGGYLTAMGLSRASDLFAAGVDLHGVHDWNNGIQNFIPSYNVLEIPEKARTAFEASPMAAIDDWRSPVLLIHGDDDRNVAFSETVSLVEALRKRNVHVETLIFPDEVHGFLRHENWLRAYNAAFDFFERKLRK